MHSRIGQPDKAFAFDHFLAQTNIKLIVGMEVGEFLTMDRQGSKPVGAAGPCFLFDANLAKPLAELGTQLVQGTSRPGQRTYRVACSDPSHFRTSMVFES